jgi:hypothetical protein
MPFIKISQLTTATAVSATNQLEINQNGASRSAEVSVLATYVRSSATNVLVLPAGSAAAPALFPTGDTNTGIFFPAADTIAFSEGGAEVMRIDNQGRVGIGTASLATQRMRVEYTISDATASSINIQANGTHTLTADNAFFYTGFSGGAALNQGGFNATLSLPSGGSLQSYRTLTQVTGASGTVTAAAGVLADVRNTGAGTLTTGVGFHAGAVVNSGGGTLTNAMGFYATAQTAGTNNFGFYSNTASGTGRWNFYANGTADNYFAGDVGIGITTPTARLNVVDATSQDAVRITQTGSGNALVVEDSTNPDATPFVVDANGQVVRGHTVALATANYAGNSATPAIQQHGNSISLGTIGSTVWSSGSASNASGLILSRSKSETVGTFASVASGDALGTVSFNGDDGTQFIPAASIIATVDGTPGTSDMPGRLVFATTADGAAAPSERMRIDNQGRVGIGAVPTTASGFVVNKIGSASSPSAVLFPITIPQTATGTAILVDTIGSTTEAAAFTLGALLHYRARPAATFGAGSSVTNQYGFWADGALTGATNNFGFYSNIASGTGRWNFYANGTADNYFAGNVGVGITTPTARLNVVDATTQDAVRITQTGTGNALVVEDATNPDSSPFVVNADGFLITGAATNQAANLATGNARVQILGGTAPLAFFRDADSSTAINLEFAKRRATGGLLASGDVIGRLYFSGNDGVAAIPAAFIDAAVDGTPGTNDMPGRLVFSTTADGASTPTERMRIDNVGRVGIGTTTPTALLTVGGTAPRLDFAESDGSAGFNTTTLVRDADIFAIQTRNSGTFVSNDYRITTNASGALTHEWRIANTQRMLIDSAGQVQVGAGTAAAPALSTLTDTNTGMFFPAADTIAFSEGGTESMRINSSGNVSIGSTTTNARLTVDGVGPTLTGQDFAFYAQSGGATNTGYATGQTVTNSIWASDRISASEFNARSDRRLKTDITPIPADDAFRLIESVPAVHYKWKNAPNGGVKFGFIAQDLVKAGFPNLVGAYHDTSVEEETDADGLTSAAGIAMTVNYDQIIPILAVTIKGLKAEVDALKARIATLENS